MCQRYALDIVRVLVVSTVLALRKLRKRKLQVSYPTNELSVRVAGDGGVG